MGKAPSHVETHISELQNTLGFAPQALKGVWPSIDILSLDVFDTILARRTTSPSDVFSWMEIRYDMQGFAEARIAAEANARSKYTGRGSEVSIEEIYESFPEALTVSGDIIERELHAERQFLFSNPSILALIQVARREGIRVIAVSDIYLSSTQVSFLLAEAGVEVDAVYTSCDFRDEDLGKYNGSLFERVAESEAVSCDRFLHVGDNLISDVRNANDAGCIAIWTQNLHDQIAANDSAVRLLSRSAQNSTDRIVVAQSSKHRMFVSDDPPMVEKFAYSFGGPLVLGFLHFILECAEREGIDRLVLLERDGCILWEAAQLLPDIKVNMRLVPCSRRLAALPCLAIGETTPVLKLFDDQRLTEKEFFDVLVLPYPKDFGSSGGVVATPEEHLHAHREVLLAQSKSELSSLREELFDELDLVSNGGRIAWVDVGWGLSSASSLNLALGIDAPCYCVGSHRWVSASLSNKGYLFEAGLPQHVCDPIVSAPELIELVFSASSPSTAYLDRIGETSRRISKPQPIEENIRNISVDVAEKAALQFIRDIADLLPGLEFDELCEFNRRIFVEICKSPPSDLHKALCRIPHDRMAGDQAWATIGDYWGKDYSGMTTDEYLRKQLVLAREKPIKQLKNKAIFKLLNALSKASPPIPSRMAARFARSAEKRNPRRMT